jgi:hypothetical protein
MVCQLLLGVSEAGHRCHDVHRPAEFIISQPWNPKAIVT